MKLIKLFSVLFLITLLSSLSLAQLDSVWYQGPAVGSVTSGAMVNTNNFTPSNNLKDPKIIPSPKIPAGQSKVLLNINEFELPDYYYVEDKSINNNQGNGGQTVLLNSWNGHNMTNSFPPDPDIAVGPNHIITTVNSEFTIWDKEGNNIKTIDADQWCLQVLGNPGAFDPQIIYDFYEDKWFMLWDAKSSSIDNSYIISYSDDSDPNGVWYSYAINANVNGSTNTTGWADYPKVGFDEEAIYITSNQFANSGSGFMYAKIRIISKSDLYNSNGGPLSWNDIWEIRTPGQGLSGQVVFTIQPTVSFTNGNNGYFIWAQVNGNNYYSIFKISNATTSPWLRGQTIPVQPYGRAPDANQLGGGVPLEAFNGSQINTKMIVRDGLLYAVHPIRNTMNSNYSSLKYFIIDVTDASIVEQAEFGAVGYFYLCPILTVDKDHNIAITYSRSGDNEYAGGYYSTKYNGDPPGLNSSQRLAEGQGNYIVTGGGSRNRWGDYHGIYLDPSNEYDVWIFPEYVAGTNIWGTYVGKIRMEPFAGIYSYALPDPLECGDVEVNTESEVFDIIISNYGTDDLVISNIDASVGPFNRVSNHTFPLTLSTYDSLLVQIKFLPTQAGDYSEMLGVTSNEPELTGIQLIGHSYDMLEAASNYFYSSTGPVSNGDMLTIDKNTGMGTVLGPSLFNQVTAIAVNPTNNIIYGITLVSGVTEIVRVNAGAGDAYKLFDIDLTQINGIAFDTLGTMYLARQTGGIYSVDLSTQNYTLVTQATISINCITFSPATNQLFAGVFKAIGVGKDSVYTIDLTTGVATPVGVTGFSVMTNDMTFTKGNQLYGVVGTATQVGKLIEINTTDGTGTQIGEIGFNNVVGLAYSINGSTVSVGNDGQIVPGEFSLEQNYPNPFNPSTTITYQLADYGQVTLKVYDVLGNEMMTLVNEPKAAGSYQVEFDASALTSGVYFYQLKSGNLVQTKKMVLLK